MQAADVLAALGKLGLSAETGTPAELAARIKSEAASYAAVIREAGIKAE
jgi:tripartite-type tricarboxylate transporter receptor subunit TctC